MRSTILEPRPDYQAGWQLPLALLVTWVLALHPEGRAQEPEKGAPGVEPGAVEVRFIDGGVLKLTLLDEAIEIVTSSGKKSVRLADLRKVELAPRLSEDDAKLIEAAVRGLGSNSFKQRERSTAYLLRRGIAAYSALVAAAKSDDPETRRRAAAIIEVLKETLPEALFQFRTEDMVQTGEGKLTGKIAQKTWKAATTQFGPVEVKVADVARAVSLAHPEEVEEKLAAQPDPGHLNALAAQVGKVFVFRVTGAARGNIWGTGTYTSDSMLAVAAVHAGVLKVGQTGTVTVRIVAGLNAYVGSTQNGVTTRPYGPWSAAYEIVK
jgi:LCCL domain-containing protein